MEERIIKDCVSVSGKNKWVGTSFLEMLKKSWIEESVKENVLTFGHIKLDVPQKEHQCIEKLLKYVK